MKEQKKMKNKRKSMDDVTDDSWSEEDIQIGQLLLAGKSAWYKDFVESFGDIAIHRTNFVCM